MTRSPAAEAFDQLKRDGHSELAFEFWHFVLQLQKERAEFKSRAKAAEAARDQAEVVSDDQ